MIKNLFRPMALLAAVTLPMMAQVQLPGAQPAAPAEGQGPSQEEVEAFQKIANMQIRTLADADARISAADDFVVTYPDSQLRGVVFTYAAEASQMKQDSGKAIFYYEKALEVDEKDYNAMLMIAAELANNTKEFDLNKEEKLSRATTLAHDGMALAEVAAKPNPETPDADWEDLRKDDLARGHEALGMIAMARKNYDDAATEFQTGIDTAAHPQPATYIRLGNAFNEAGKPDDAMRVLDQVINMQGLPQVFIDVAKNERTRSEQIKANQ